MMIVEDGHCSLEDAGTTVIVNGQKIN